MPRSLKKGPFCDAKLLIKVAKARANGTNLVEKTWSRRSTILPEMLGVTINVHNGKIFMPVLVTEEMIGYKLGWFVPTTTFKGHGGRDAKAAKK
ncbi:MAG: 30S ribosomal protein S19 [bacterium]